MAAPSVTNTFTNGTTADATEVNQNFTDVINGITDGTKDLTISAFTANGTATFNGAVTLGNATGDDITITGYVASTVIPKTNAAYDLGSQALNWQSLYLDDDSTNGGTIYFDADGTTFIRCNAAGTDIIIDGVSTVTIDATLQPQSDATSPIGTTSLGWTSLYLDNGATDGGAVFFDGSNTSFLKSDSSGADLALGGFTGFDLAGAKVKEFALEDQAKSADYTVTDTDGISVIFMTTGATTRTVTLPTAADNDGRVITVKKIDSGVGLCVIDGEGAETIDGTTTVKCPLQYDFITVQCDGTEWHIINRNDVSKWQSWTPTGSWSGTTTYTGYYRRVGVDMEVDIKIALTGTPTGAALTITLPNSWTIDTSLLTSTTSTDNKNFGQVTIADSGAEDLSGRVGYDDTTRIAILLGYASTTHWNITNPVSGSGNDPITWANGDAVYIRASFPISEWS